MLVSKDQPHPGLPTGTSIGFRAQVLASGVLTAFCSAQRLCLGTLQVALLYFTTYFVAGRSGWDQNAVPSQA